MIKSIELIKCSVFFRLGNFRLQSKPNAFSIWIKLKKEAVLFQMNEWK